MVLSGMGSHTHGGKLVASPESDRLTVNVAFLTHLYQRPFVSLEDDGAPNGINAHPRGTPAQEPHTIPTSPTALR